MTFVPQMHGDPEQRRPVGDGHAKRDTDDGFGSLNGMARTRTRSLGHCIRHGAHQDALIWFQLCKVSLQNLKICSRVRCSTPLTQRVYLINLAVSNNSNVSTANSLQYMSLKIDSSTVTVLGDMPWKLSRDDGGVGLKRKCAAAGNHPP